MRSASLYSKFVGALKILLPLAALVLLSTMFMLSRGQESALELASFLGRDGEDALQVGMSAPKFSGATEQGDHVSIQAVHAKPELGGLISATQITADLDLTKGGEISLVAAEALIDDTQSQLDLIGAVEITTSTGYVARTQILKMQTDRIAGETQSPVEASGPAGVLSADRLVFTQDDETGDVQMHFTGNVKLVYEPQAK